MSFDVSRVDDEADGSPRWSPITPSRISKGGGGGGGGVSGGGGGLAAAAARAAKEQAVVDSAAAALAVRKEAMKRRQVSGVSLVSSLVGEAARQGRRVCRKDYVCEEEAAYETTSTHALAPTEASGAIWRHLASRRRRRAWVRC